MICKKCKSDKYEIRQVNSRSGIYCKDCGAWIKWATNEERNNYYKEELKKPENRDKVLRTYFKNNGIVRIKCGKCKCQLFNSNAPEPIGQFNLLKAKFCPQCGVELL